MLVLLCLTVYLPGLFTIPPIDRDESRFAQASRQMFEAAALPEAQKDPSMHSGGWVVPMLQDKPRLNKPPLVYWLQVASAWVFTGGDPLKDEIWMYRIPGVLCAMATVLMTWRMGRTMFDPRAAFLGAALLAVCPLVVFDAHQARADQLLLTTVVATQWALWSVWRGAKRFGTSPTRKRGNGKPSATDAVPMPDDASQTLAGASGSYSTPADRGLAPISFWVCLGVSILAKGPIGPMIAALTCLALCLASRRWRWLLALRPLVGVVIVAAIVAPWLYAVGEHVGWSKYLAIIKDETIGRSLEPKEGHWGPPGYHTVLLAVLFWPGSLTTAMAVGRAFNRGWPRMGPGSRLRKEAGSQAQVTPGHLAGPMSETGSPDSMWLRLRSWFDRRPGRDADFFCLAWIVPAWIVFELIGTKLPHYTLPMYPAVAIISARTFLSLAGLAREDRIWNAQRLGRVVWTSIGMVVIGGATMLFGLWTLGAGSFIPPNLVGATILGSLLVLVLASVLCWQSFTALRTRHMLESLVRVNTALLLFDAVFFQVIAPRVLPGSLTPDLVRGLMNTDHWELRAIVSEYHEDSLVFSTRGRVQRIDTSQTAAWWRTHADGIAIVKLEPPGNLPSESDFRCLGGARPTTFLPGLYKYAVIERRSRLPVDVP